MIINGSVQWIPIQSLVEFCLQQCLNSESCDLKSKALTTWPPGCFKAEEIKTWYYNILLLACGGHINLSKIDEICPLAIPNKISTISMQIPSLVRIHWNVLKLSYGNKKYGWTTDGQTHGTILYYHYSLVGYKNYSKCSKKLNRKINNETWIHYYLSSPMKQREVSNFAKGMGKVVTALDINPCPAE